MKPGVPTIADCRDALREPVQTFVRVPIRKMHDNPREALRSAVAAFSVQSSTEKRARSVEKQVVQFYTRKQKRTRTQSATNPVPVTYMYGGFSYVAIVLIFAITFSPVAPVFAEELEESTEQIEEVQESVTDPLEHVPTEETTKEPLSEEEVVVEDEEVTEDTKENPLEEEDVIEEVSLEEKLEEITDDMAAAEEQEVHVDLIEDENVDEPLVEEEHTVEVDEQEVVEEAPTEEETEEQIVHATSTTVHTEVVEEKVDEEVVEQITPVIELRGVEMVYFVRGLGDVYNDLGAVAQDEFGADLSVKTFLNEEEVDRVEIDTSEVGEYVITYRAEHATGGVAEVTRAVIVEEHVLEEKEDETLDVQEEEISEETEDESSASEESRVEESDTLDDEPENITEPALEENEISDVATFNPATETKEQIDLEKLRKEIREELSDEIRRTISKELRDGCLEFEDSSYYCMSASETATFTQSEGEVRVSSARDNEGDEEIFLHRNGKKMQITHNNTEDRFPSSDVFGERIVWQSQVESIWQIMMHDTRTGETSQLTDTSFNNMNPHVYKGSVVWQGWVQNSWEIFHAKVGGNGSWNITQVTHNDWHDVFPRAALGLVTWQSFEGGAWSVMMHDIATGSTSRLSEGLDKYENPRFALLWDGRNDAGEVSVFEYDLSSGAIEDLRKKHEPKEKEEIPEAPVEHEVPLPARSEVATSTQLLKDDETDE